MDKIIKTTIWSPTTYKNYKQYINYFCHTNPIFSKLSASPPIVSTQKILQTKKNIVNCQNGKSVLLHIGDCAEPFQHIEQTILQKKISFMKDCQLILSQTKKKPAFLIGRIAGQYAKPRSQQFTEKNGIKIHNYKGDNINSLCENDRNPCENKLFKGYQNSFYTAKLINQNYPNLFISHEGLVLPYEQSFIKKTNGKYYCQSAHMIWIGQRTRQLDGAHVEFFRGLQNPIGIKISSNIKQQQFIDLIRTLNPQNQKGKLLVIIRMGRQKIKNHLSTLINIKLNEGFNFLFVTDPMHGNTYESKIAKLKTRSLDHILQQIKHFQYEMDNKKINYGYSLESTFEDVTECHGLTFPLKQFEIQKQLYKSKCDPRLNRSQTLKLLSVLSS